MEFKNSVNNWIYHESGDVTIVKELHVRDEESPLDLFSSSYN